MMEKKSQQLYFSSAGSEEVTHQFKESSFWGEMKSDEVWFTF